MGRDKALLKYGDGVLVQQVAQAVAKAAGSAVLVGSPARYGSLGYGVTPDVYPGEGPLGGILTALQNSAADWSLIVACDMPALTAEFLSRLFTTAEACGGDVLAPAGPTGKLEPLCAVYHRRSGQGLYRAFESGVRSVVRALQEVRTVTWNLPDAEFFHNVNTPEDWSAYAG